MRSRVARQDASWLVKITSLFSLVLGFFKIFKSFSVRTRGAAKNDSKQAETDEIDRLAFKYLSPPLLLLIAGYSGHSLATGYHRGWYAWLIESLVALVYGGGFIVMTPQVGAAATPPSPADPCSFVHRYAPVRCSTSGVGPPLISSNGCSWSLAVTDRVRLLLIAKLFINYRLKSVAHLNWKFFMYKALNTFIDDLFAFIIKMPTLHRMSCFRDDIVFAVFMYQRYVYRVDMSRRNEFGHTGEVADETKEAADKKKKKGKGQKGAGAKHGPEAAPAMQLPAGAALEELQRSVVKIQARARGRIERTRVGTGRHDDPVPAAEPVQQAKATSKKKKPKKDKDV